MAIVPYVPEREYADLSYSDHSRYLRGNVRSLQRSGEQLWDSDHNNNMLLYNLWESMTVIYRRDQKSGHRPPYYSPVTQKYIIDPKWANVPEGGEDLIYLFTAGMLAPLYYKPQNGSFAWVKADQMLVAYCQDEWRAAARRDTSDSNVEIAIYAKGVKRGSTRPFVATHVVGQPFKLLASGHFSRARGISQLGSLLVTKNGVQVGTVYKTAYSSGINAQGDITFNTGDVFGIQIPALGSINDEISITLIGSLL